MKYLLLCLLAFFSLPAVAQDSAYYARPDSIPPAFEITLKTGTKLRGRILYQDEKICRILTEKGMELEISPSEILRSERTDIDPRRFPNAFPHRLISYPTAFPIARGSTEYSTNYLVASRIGYGLAKNLSLAGSFFTFNPPRMFALHAKWTVVNARMFRVALDGNLYSGTRTGGTVFLPQLIMTVGSADNSFTFGGGPVVDRWYLTEVDRVFVFGGITKISKGTSLVTQNQVLVSQRTGSAGILALGVRMNGRRAGFDGGLAVITGRRDEVSIGTSVLPYFGFMVKLGKR